MKLLKNQESVRYPIFMSPLSEIPRDKKLLVSTINQYSYVVAEKDKEFKRALINSDVLLPDGIAIVYASLLSTKRKIKKISGTDLHTHLLKQLNEEKGSCFYLGSSESTLAKISDRMERDYPSVRFSIYSPPYKPEFTKEDNEKMIAAVNSFKPDVLFIGMTAPKQEKWAFRHKEQLSAKMICSIGAVFDFYAGTVVRPSKLWISLGLEWMGRFVKEPKRLWKRYFYHGPIFLYLIFKSNLIGAAKPVQDQKIAKYKIKTYRLDKNIVIHKIPNT